VQAFAPARVFRAAAAASAAVAPAYKAVPGIAPVLLRLRSGRCPHPMAHYGRECGGAERTALTICSGLIGVALNSAPKGASASLTALAIAAGGATAPPSPTPLTPSGFSDDGECWWTSTISGMSPAVGTM